MARRCLVTGGAGFIGSHLVHALLCDGWSVRVLDTGCVHISNFVDVIGQVDLIQGDFADKAVTRSALEDVDTLFHFASTTTPATAHSHSVFDVTTNLAGTLGLLEEAVARGVERFIFPSSGGTVYGPITEIPVPETHPTNPICSHGIVKLALENYIRLFQREYGLNYTILRYSNPYGPRQRPDGPQGAVAVFARKVLTHQPIEIWGDGSTVRDFIYIDDLARATMAAVHSESAVNQIINIGSGTGTSLRELAEVIEAVTGMDAIVHFGPARRFDVPANVLAIERARNLLSWAPAISIKEGIARVVPWLRGYLASKSKQDAFNALS